MRNATRVALSAIALALALAAPAAAGAGETPSPLPAEPTAERTGAEKVKATTRGPAVRPVTPPKAMLAGLRKHDDDLAKGKLPSLGADGPTTTATTADEAFWSFGVTEQQYGLNCSIVGQPFYEPQVTSQIGYGGTAGVPKVGERFNIVLLFSHPGMACSGGFLADVYAELRMTTGGRLAIDETHGIQCFTNSRTNPNQYTDVTNSTWTSPDGSRGKWCETSGAIGMHGGINLGLRKLVTGTIFQIVIPAIATKELKGAAHLPSPAVFQGTSQSVIAIPTHQIAYPEVWANVLGYYPATVSYPTPSVTELTPTSAKLTGHVYNHFKAGTARIELGPTTAYGINSDEVALSPDFDANAMWATYSGLRPTQTYHWRVRFTGADGAVAYGPDQTFTTPAASVVGKVGTTLSMTAYGLRANNIRVSTVDGNVRFEDLAYSMVPAAGCTAETAKAIRCPAAGITSVVVDGGAYSDTIAVAPTMTTKTTLKGNTGNDRLTGGGGVDTLEGGTGADTLAGGGGTADTATYAYRSATQPVAVSLDGVANDGGTADVAGTVKDNVGADVENLTGGAGADTLTGDSRANVLTGGRGADTLRGMAGPDRVLAYDNVVDLVIDCGEGTDRGSADLTPVDPAAVSCEALTKF